MEARPKYRLGKVKSKYHILDILSYSDYQGAAGSLLFQSSSTLRELLKQNIDIFKKYMMSIDYLEIDDKSQLLDKGLTQYKSLRIICHDLTHEDI
jgi:hypothetical protein